EGIEQQAGAQEGQVQAGDEERGNIDDGAGAEGRHEFALLGLQVIDQGIGAVLDGIYGVDQAKKRMPAIQQYGPALFGAQHTAGFQGQQQAQRVDENRAGQLQGGSDQLHLSLLSVRAWRRRKADS